MQQDRAEDECQGGADIDGQEQQAVVCGKTDAAVVGPGSGIDADRQRIGQRVRGPVGRHQAPVGGIGNQEQQQQVAEAGGKQGRQFMAHRNRLAGASARPRE